MSFVSGAFGGRGEATATLFDVSPVGEGVAQAVDENPDDRFGQYRTLSLLLAAGAGSLCALVLPVPGGKD